MTDNESGMPEMIIKGLKTELFSSEEKQLN
jgi:hypothetical protein